VKPRGSAPSAVENHTWLDAGYQSVGAVLGTRSLCEERQCHHATGPENQTPQEAPTIEATGIYD
jgi:hypothetical protein